MLSFCLLFTMWVHNGKVAIYKQETGLLPEPEHTGTLILNFSASRIVSNKFLLFKPPSVCVCVCVCVYLRVCIYIEYLLQLYMPNTEKLWNMIPVFMKLIISLGKVTVYLFNISLGLSVTYF